MSIKLQILLNFCENVSWKSTKIIPADLLDTLSLTDFHYCTDYKPIWCCAAVGRDSSRDIVTIVSSICLFANLQTSADGLYVRRSPNVPTVSDVEQWKVDIKRRSIVIVSVVLVHGTRNFVILAGCVNPTIRCHFLKWKLRFPWFQISWVSDWICNFFPWASSAMEAMKFGTKVA